MIYTLHTKHYSDGRIEKTETGERVARVGERGDAYRISVEKYVGKSPLGKTSLRWENLQWKGERAELD